MGRRLGRVVVALTVSLISFISYSSQLFIIWPWYGRELSVELLALLIPFNLLVGMLFWNYWLCVLTDPGTVPHSWVPDVQSGEGYEVKPLTGTPRYCRTCEKYKPPRAHHCRQCRRCHHCPWVNNCIGHFNYGHFIRFLFYVDVACTYHVAMVTRRVVEGVGKRYWDEPSSVELIFIVLNYVTCVPVLMAVGGFSLYHFYSLLGNSTTIEGWEKDKAATLFRRGKIQEIKFPYNLGAKRNVVSVLGPKPLLWCWPTVPPGNGLKYDLADGDDGTAWPPRDPSAYSDVDPKHAFTLPDSPWTFGNGSLNPRLEPSNVRRRRRPEAISSVPPYHPDYHNPAGISGYAPADSDSEQSSLDEYELPPTMPRVRSGSEGYEVRPVDREQLLREYVESQVQEPGRYHHYVPEQSENYMDDEDEDEDVPLAHGQEIRTRG